LGDIKKAVLVTSKSPFGDIWVTLKKLIWRCKNSQKLPTAPVLEQRFTSFAKNGPIRCQFEREFGLFVGFPQPTLFCCDIYVSQRLTSDKNTVKTQNMHFVVLFTMTSSAKDKPRIFEFYTG
jgi:hypothetical protein